MGKKNMFWKEEKVDNIGAINVVYVRYDSK
jgi:hypothetical protein